MTQWVLELGRDKVVWVDTTMWCQYHRHLLLPATFFPTWGAHAGNTVSWAPLISKSEPENTNLFLILFSLCWFGNLCSGHFPDEEDKAQEVSPPKITHMVNGRHLELGSPSQSAQGFSAVPLGHCVHCWLRRLVWNCLCLYFLVLIEIKTPALKGPLWG